MNSNLPTIPCRLTLFRGFALVLMACVILFAGDLFAAGPTLVSGNVSGTWSPTNNPYVLVDHCTVPADKTLTIQPGVEVIIGQGLNLTVNGNILARGTATQRIVFRAPNSSTYWGSLMINWSKRTNDFTDCDFSRGTVALSVECDASRERDQTPPALLTGCLFEDCLAGAIKAVAKGHAGWVSGTFGREGINCRLHVTVRGCLIKNTAAALLLRSEGEAFMDAVGYAFVETTVVNTVFHTTGSGIVTQENEFSGASSGKLRNNAFINCNAAIEVTPTFDCLVRNNVFVSCETGVKRSGATSSQVGFNCFHNTQTKFSGYPSAFGTVAMNNANGTPCDVAFNIFENPKFAETVSFLLAPDSPCVDAGDPAAAYNDVRFPPSRGKAVNDIGAYGGPNVLADDADMDGLLDAWEIQYFDNLETTDGASDPDEDGLINTREALYGTNPTKADTDGDGFNDLAEVRAGTSPTDPNSLPNFALGIEVVAYDLELATAAGRRYQLQASEGFGLWDNLFDPIVGDGNVVRKRVEVGDTHYRFFKVKDITNP